MKKDDPEFLQAKNSISKKVAEAFYAEAQRYDGKGREFINALYFGLLEGTADALVQLYKHNEGFIADSFPKLVNIAQKDLAMSCLRIFTIQSRSVNKKPQEGFVDPGGN